MKVLHAALSKKIANGMLRQMILEQIAADELAINWVTKVITPDNTDILKDFSEHERLIAQSVIVSNTSVSLGWLPVKRLFYDWLVSEQDNYDVIVLRYSMTDPFLPLFIKQCKKPVFLVHHTFEVPEIRTQGGMKSTIRAFTESFLGQLSLRFAEQLIGVTDEILKYEKGRISDKSKSGYVYPNGYTMKGQVVDDIRGDVPELLFVASQFHNWHGLDILLDDIIKTKKNFKLHLVGELTEKQKVKVKNDTRIITHGRLKFGQLSKIASGCHVALSSFALYRKGMREACTLKVREYLAMGLPVYAGYKDCFPTHFPYYKNGPAEIDSIINYAQSLSNVSRLKISTEAQPYIDKEKLLSDFHNWIKESVS